MSSSRAVVSCSTRWVACSVAASSRFVLCRLPCPVCMSCWPVPMSCWVLSMVLFNWSVLVFRPAKVCSALAKMPSIFGSLMRASRSLKVRLAVPKVVFTCMSVVLACTRLTRRASTAEGTPCCGSPRRFMSAVSSASTGSTRSKMRFSSASMPPSVFNASSEPLGIGVPPAGPGSRTSSEVTILSLEIRSTAPWVTKAACFCLITTSPVMRPSVCKSSASR